MKAIAVVPGQPDSVHLADLPKPHVDDVPDGRTMAELSQEEKDAISHRGRAVRELLTLLSAG